MLACGGRGMIRVPVAHLSVVSLLPRHLCGRCLGHRDIRHVFDALADVSCRAHSPQDRVGLIEVGHLTYLTMTSPLGHR